jgi:hypothetical protein
LVSSPRLVKPIVPISSNVGGLHHRYERCAVRAGIWWFMLNRSAIVVKPRQPFLDWLHSADPTSHRLTLRDSTREPTIYLIPECDTEEDVREVLEELCEEIFVAQLAGWFRDEQAWPQDLGFDAFCRWFDFQHHSMLVDLCDEPLIDEFD